MDPWVFSVVRARPGWKAVDLSLFDECCMRPDPRLIDVEMLKSVLLLVLPFHMLLFVANRVPPYIEQAISPSASSDEERTQIESTAVLRNNEVDGFRLPVTDRGAGLGVEMFIGEGMADIKGVVDINVAVSIAGKVVEYMTL